MSPRVHRFIAAVIVGVTGAVIGNGLGCLLPPHTFSWPDVIGAALVLTCIDLRRASR